jgi:hypothetical protein
LGPIGILLRVAKKLQHFSTIANGYTHGLVTVDILPRVAKKLQPLTQSLTDIPTHSPTDGAHSNAYDH